MDNKRLVTFLMLTMLIMVGYWQLRLILNPPPPPEVAQQDDQPGEGNDDADQDDGPAHQDDEPGDADEPGDGVTKRKQVKPSWQSLGSINPADNYRMLLTFTNKGAALVRAELSSVAYRDLEDDDGYLGHLELTDEGNDGARINVVGRGTPAAHAKCTSGERSGGLQVGDEIVQFNDTKLETTPERSYADHYLQLFHETHPGETVTLKIRPHDAPAGSTKTLTYEVSLTHPPMQVIQPEHFVFDKPSTKLQPFSFLTTLGRAGGSFQPYNRDKSHPMWEEEWEVLETESPDEVKFRFLVTPEEFEDLDLTGPVEVIKTFRIAKAPAADASTNEPPGYSVNYSLEVNNLGEKEAPVRVQQNGPTGLPLEGWWYIRKGSPHFGSAGVRDIVWSTVENPAVELIRNVVVFTHFNDDEEKHNPFKPFALKDDTAGQHLEMNYVGVDSPYFSAVMLPDKSAPDFEPNSFRYDRADAIVVSELDKNRKQTTDLTFRLFSDEDIRAGDSNSFRQDYTIFIGPKDPQILSHYGLQDTIIYGWPIFGYIARLLLVGLNAIHWLIPNYGIAIILLTICVRLLVFPIGRKQAQNAAMMQMLAPEMKEIADKHKDDMEARTKATQELWKKHNYNPFGGCWLMFLQLPIFFGLYKALSTSIDLRQESLIPGIQWCSNLAGPDMFWYWEPYLWSMIGGYNGYLGPYLNILPLVTIGLFIVHQKLFTPPPTDENQAMQQKMMSYMMIFMGFLFFKVPSGLCLYFITSSLWGIAERKLFPKPKVKPAKIDGKASKSTAATEKKAVSKENTLAEMFSNLLQKPESNGDNGDAKRRQRRKKKKK